MGQNAVIAPVIVVRTAASSGAGTALTAAVGLIAEASGAGTALTAAVTPVTAVAVPAVAVSGPSAAAVPATASGAAAWFEVGRRPGPVTPARFGRRSGGRGAAQEHD